MFHSPGLRRQLQGTEGALWRREGETLLLALPYAPRRPMPLTGMFCFARPCRIRGERYLVWTFDSRERPVLDVYKRQIPGIGKVYSAGIIAEIGDIRRFNSQASVAKFAGLVWHKDQSGEFEAEHSRMIKSGNRYLRYYLLEAANSVRRCDSEFRRYYDLKYHEAVSYTHLDVYKRQPPGCRPSQEHLTKSKPPSH